MAAALDRWVRTEMELPPLPGPVLRRTVKKIRGNLLWYQHLEKEGAGPTLGGAVRRLRQEVEGLGGALGGTQEAALELEAALWAGLSRRWAELRRGAELRLLGAEQQRTNQRLGAWPAALRPPKGPGGAGPALGGAAGAELEVLGAVRAVCKSRAEVLGAGLELEQPIRTQEVMEAANQRWRREAEAVLSRYPPALVLWALQRLAEESSRLWEAEPEPNPELDPELDPEAPPTVKSLIQDLWGAVGSLWGRLPPMAARLRPLEQRLQQLRLKLEGDPKTLQAARLAVGVAGLCGTRQALQRGVRGLRDPPKPALGDERRRLRRRQRALLRRARRLRFLIGATRGLRERLRPLQEQVRGEGRVGPPPELEGEGQRMRRLLGELGALGEAPPSPAPDPLLPVSRALGLPPHKAREGALRRAARLKRDMRRRGAGPEEGAWPALPRPVGPIVGAADAELLPRLRLVAAQTQQQIEDWPRLLELVNHWWTQPAQWTLATPPGSLPFSHWLQRWTRAAKALPWPRPLPLAPPTEGQDQEQPPL
ncbi:HAUS augmin-like complex subunit 5 isoform X3 [Patagioenas fasciata]|uniref:HAUS augmin-like complex subunit 5 isoform X3 n=1 Tax=Patagioenas fasciata TaxID=372321 RepID=UPI003A9A310D